MRRLLLTILLMFIFIGCGSEKSTQQTTSTTDTLWEEIKQNSSPTLHLSTEFSSPKRVNSVATLAWEDGLYISDDALSIFSFYAPTDIFKWVEYSTANPICPSLENFIRGEVLEGTDLDLTAPYDNPWGCTEGLMHSEIAYATRDSIEQPFGSWSRHALSNDFLYDGGFVASSNGDGTYDLVYSRSNAANKNDIYWLRNSSLNPSSASATPISETINSSEQEDNPHLERLSANNLVLLYDNHGVGDADTQISYSISNDNGTTWSLPQLLSLNSASASEDLQAHLYKDATNNWWLYFSSNREGSMQIYRSKHSTNDLLNDFDNWEAAEKVLSRGDISNAIGTTVGVGEPSLSDNGDLYFSVVYCKNQEDQTEFDSCDIDPWMISKIE